MSPKLIDASTYLPFYFFYPFTFLPLNSLFTSPLEPYQSSP